MSVSIIPVICLYNGNILRTETYVKCVRNKVVIVPLHDDDANVVDGDVAEAVHDGLPAEPKPTLPLGCRWRVPLTRVHNPYGVLLLY